MASESSLKNSPKTCCILTSIFECFSSSGKEDNGRDGREWPRGNEREVQFLNQQPHLVQPMTLTVFDALPPMATASQPSQLSQLVSKSMTSLRGSVSSQRRGNRLPISGPTEPSAMPATTIQCPATKLEPLELTIHKDDNRLSDLPRFDRLSFTDEGELKSQPRTLERTLSESAPVLAKAVSMMDQPRPRFISMSRPASEHDALHSHPVSTASLPCIPPPINVQAPVEPTRPRPVETEVLTKYYHPDHRVQRRISRWLATNHSSSWDTADISERRLRRAAFYQFSSLPRSDAPGMEDRQRNFTESTVVSNAGTEWSMGLQNPTNTTITTTSSPILSGFVNNTTQAIGPTNSETIDGSPLSAEVVDGVVDDIMLDEHGEAARGSDVGVAF